MKDYIKKVDNVYMTLNYIVAQKIIRVNNFNEIKTISIDVFFLKTEERENLFLKLLRKEKNVTGIRFKSDLSLRKYIN